jgi:ABC-2 type transport system permease protein
MMTSDFSLQHSLRLIGWNLRREMWEHRALWVAPLAVAILEVLGTIGGLRHMPRDLSSVLKLDDAERQYAVAAGYNFIALPILGVMVIVAFFYCLDTLYSERRDRSVLFWKSLPVSDAMTVGAKSLVPFAVLPVIAFFVICTTQFVILTLGSVVLSVTGSEAAQLWRDAPIGFMPILVGYFLLTMTLWYAPIYGWLFLASSFAKRASFLWAVLPLIAIEILEYFAMGTSDFAHWLSYRLSGFMHEGLIVEGKRDAVITRFDQLDPAHFFSSQGLWSGLALAVLFFLAAIRMRRAREIG